MDLTVDPAAHHERRARRRYREALRRAGAVATDAEYCELERLVRAERLGLVSLRDATADALGVVEAHRAHQPAPCGPTTTP